MGVRLGAAALLLISLCAVRGQWPLDRGVIDPLFAAGNVTRQQKTTKDKLYSKEQAARGGELFANYCDQCHTPGKVPEGKKAGPPVVGPKFFDNWADRPLGELFNQILTTMPSDGSAVLTADQTLDAVAHILKANGFPEGPAPLKNDDAMKTAVIVKIPQ